MKRLVSNWRPVLALALVGLIELGLFVDVHLQRWENVVLGSGLTSEKAGEGLVIRGNGLGYYAWLRSLLIDHDWSFDNEFDEHNITGDYVPPATYRTELGRRANQWSVGPACVWALAVVPGHYMLRALGEWSPWEANGYSLPYQLLVGVASLVMSFVGLGFLYGVCRQFARPSRAALAAALLTLGSTIVYYAAVEVSMAHGLGTVFLAAFVWYWLTTYGSLRPGRWLLVGALLGSACLMRWQLATFAALPIGEALLRYGRERNESVKRSAGLALAAAGALVAFLPQMIAWRCVYGHWFVEPVPQLAHHWLSPSLWEVLLSQDRSLFYWTPITALALSGYLLCRRSARAEPAFLVLVAFGLQVYALASVWGKGEYLKNVGNSAGAHLSFAYGMRHLTEAVVALAPALAILLERAGRWPFRLLCAIGFPLGLGNLVLACAYTDGRLPRGGGTGLQSLFATTCGFVESETALLLVIVEALGMLGLVLLWRNDEPPIATG